MSRSIRTAGVVLLVLVAPAHADIVTVTYEAMIGGNDGDPPEFPANTLLQGELIYDTETPRLPYPGIDAVEAAKYAVLSHQITLNGVPFIGFNANVDADNLIGIWNDGGGTSCCSDRFAIRSGTTGTFGGTPVTGFFFGLYSLTEGFSNPVLSSADLISSQAEFDAFPETSPSLPRTSWRLATVFVPRSGFSQGIQGQLTLLEVTVDSIPVLACNGFYSPFDIALSLPGRSRRVTPLRVELLDEDGFEIGPDAITAPTVSVSYTGAMGGGELTALVGSAGRATEGNSFLWDEAEGAWKFNLSTRPFSASGTYMVSAVAGDDSYVIDPTCVGTFVLEPHRDAHDERFAV